MRIQKAGMETPIERQFLLRLMLDIERREGLPDCGLRYTHGELQWNGQPIESLSCNLPQEGRVLHAFVIAKPEVPTGIVMMVVMMLGNEAKWSQEWVVDFKKVANVSFELVYRFLELTGHIKTDRQGIEMMYPPYGLKVPELVIPEPGTQDPNRVKSYVSTPLPIVPEDSDLHA